MHSHSPNIFAPHINNIPPCSAGVLPGAGGSLAPRPRPQLRHPQRGHQRLLLRLRLQVLRCGHLRDPVQAGVSGGTEERNVTIVCKLQLDSEAGTISEASSSMQTPLNLNHFTFLADVALLMSLTMFLFQITTTQKCGTVYDTKCTSIPSESCSTIYKNKEHSANEIRAIFSIISSIQTNYYRFLF